MAEGINSPPIAIAAIAKLFESGKYSDFQIKSKTKTYDVHKAIVCPRVDVFRRKAENWTFDVSKESASFASRICWLKMILEQNTYV